MCCCVGEYKFILPPDEEGMVYQCHLCSYSGIQRIFYVYQGSGSVIIIRIRIQHILKIPDPDPEVENATC
jgi:hypothetical protein